MKAYTESGWHKPSVTDFLMTIGVFYNLWKESFWFLFLYFDMSFKLTFPFENNMTANLHYFHKLMGTQNEESESIRYFSSAIPFHPTYLLWAMKIFYNKLQLFYCKFCWSSSKESLIPFTCPSKILHYKMFLDFHLCSIALHSA